MPLRYPGIYKYLVRLLINNYELLQPLSVQITLIVGKKFVNTIFQLLEAFQFFKKILKFDVRIKRSVRLS